MRTTRTITDPIDNPQVEGPGGKTLRSPARVALTVKNRAFLGLRSDTRYQARVDAVGLPLSGE